MPQPEGNFVLAWVLALSMVYSKPLTADPLLPVTVAVYFCAALVPTAAVAHVSVKLFNVGAVTPQVVPAMGP